MIDTITLVSNGDQVTLDFDFFTTDHFSYSFEVVDDAGDQKVTGKGNESGTTNFLLGIASDLIGLYLNIFWSEINDNGAGNPFKAAATASQNNTPCNNVQIFSGTSTDTQVNDVTKAQFKV
jgi:hypothetical protein